LMSQFYKEAGDNPQKAFDKLYKSMSAVKRFGRTARFDYLTMIGNLRLAKIEPGSVYLTGATGPRAGARLLLGVKDNALIDNRILDNTLKELDKVLNVGFQVLEDSLCNWQKAPSEFVRFRG
jgi:hypothetical protein